MAYSFFVTLIDAVGQRFAVADTVSANAGQTKAPIFVTAPGLYETAYSTMDVAILCDTAGSSLYWMYVAESESAYRAVAGNRGVVPIPESAGIVFRVRKASLVDSDEASSAWPRRRARRRCGTSWTAATI